MKVTVLVMVVVGLVSSTAECGEAINSEEICEQIRSNELDILTMGTRGKSFDDAHFYILAKGGYMFKVPLANLRVDAVNKTTSITIDRDFIRADVLFNESRDLFTRENRFFFISSQNQDAFLGQMFFNSTLPKVRVREYQLYHLNGARSKEHHSKDIDLLVNRKYVMSSMAIDSNTATGCILYSDHLYVDNMFEVDNKDELKVKFNKPLDKIMMKLSGTRDIVTSFYHKENPKKDDGYYYFLDTNGLMTVSRRESQWLYPSTVQVLDDLYKDRFEVNLNSFVVCHFNSTTTDPPTSSWTYWTIIALSLGTIFVLGGLAIYFYVAMRKEKVKRRDLKKKNRKSKSNLSSFASSNLSSSNLNSSSISSGTSSSNASSNAFTLTSNPTTSSSSMASKASSVLQSIKSGISSLLSRNKTEQAKTVVKAKNSKAKAKKPKSPK